MGRQFGCALAACVVLSMAVGCSRASNSVSAEPSAQPVTLDELLNAPVPSLCKHEPGNLANGTLPMQDPYYGFVAIASRSAMDDAPMVAFGDLNGDGVDDGALVTACTAGGVGWPATVQLYTAGPTRLGGVDLGEVTKGGREHVTDISISNGVVKVTWITQGPDEPACCGTVEMSGDLRVTDDRVVPENVRRTN